MIFIVSIILLYIMYIQVDKTIAGDTILIVVPLVYSLIPIYFRRQYVITSIREVYRVYNCVPIYIPVIRPIGINIMTRCVLWCVYNIYQSMGGLRRLISNFFYGRLLCIHQIVYPMDDDKNKGFKGSSCMRRAPCVQETSPILYKLNCRITSAGCRREMLNRYNIYLVTHFP